jgi:TorA maturation chaperone TorD
MRNNTASVDNVETAEGRSKIYGFLARIYREEPNAALLRQIKDSRHELAESGVRLSDDFIQKPEQQLSENLAVEYAALFLGPGKHISPHESVHRGNADGSSGNLWGEVTGEVKRFIEHSGLEYASGYRGLPDHISVEFEFMQQLARHEAHARRENDRDRVIYCLKMEKIFMDVHLVQWVPAFCDKVLAYAELPFYGEMAKMTKGFLEFDRETVRSLCP